MQDSTAQKARLKEISEAKKPKIEKVKKKYTDNRIIFDAKEIEIVITGSDFWYKDMQGTILSVFKSIKGDLYKTVKPIERKREYGLVKSSECKEI